MEYYKKSSTEVYTTLFNKINEGNYILCIGFGKKIVIAEQMAAKQALLNLNLSLNF
jgi:dsRNA-specific ribonuclease